MNREHEIIDILTFGSSAIRTGLCYSVGLGKSRNPRECPFGSSSLTTIKFPLKYIAAPLVAPPNIYESSSVCAYEQWSSTPTAVLLLIRCVLKGAGARKYRTNIGH